MIKANCRERFTAEDFSFIARTLARTERDSVSLGNLLTDAEARDSLLDDPRLFASVMEHGAPLTISPQLYFYLLTRHVLKETGLNDRPLSDYVASLLERFSQTARMRSPADGRETTTQYVTDMMVALQTANPHQTFLIRAHMGNYSLFISGIFPERVHCRAQQRGAPDLRFYENVGRSSYAVAARHEVARSCDLSGVYEALAEAFHEVRLALNHLADSLLHLDSGSAPNDAFAFN